MEKTQEEIIVIRGKNEYRAFMKGYPPTGTGKTKREAIGDLILMLDLYKIIDWGFSAFPDKDEYIMT